MNARVINKGLIEGTRTTVYHVMDYYVDGYSAEMIAEELPITTEQAQAAINYIEQNRTKVNAEHQKMLDRCAQGNSSAIRAKLERSGRKLSRIEKELRAGVENRR